MMICDVLNCRKPAKRFSMVVSHVESTGDQIETVWDIDADLCEVHLKRLGEVLGEVLDTVIPQG